MQKVSPPPPAEPTKLDLVDKLPQKPDPLQQPDPNSQLDGVKDGTGEPPIGGGGGNALPLPEPPKPQPIAEPDDVTLLIAEQMPRLYDAECEALATETERRDCANRKLMSYVYQNIKYPEMARDMGVSGTAVISFVVDKEGKIDKIEVMKDPGASLASEAKRVVVKLSQEMYWVPGKQRGTPVKVKFNLPVRFNLK